MLTQGLPILSLRQICMTAEEHFKRVTKEDRERICRFEIRTCRFFFVREVMSVQIYFARRVCASAPYGSVLNGEICMSIDQTHVPKRGLEATHILLLPRSWYFASTNLGYSNEIGTWKVQILVP